MAQVYSGTDSDLFFLAEILRDSGIVAVPTETVYGLAAHALDESACRKVFEAKNRPAYDPLIVHVVDRAAAGEMAVFNSAAETLVQKLWPGPLTLVLPKRDVVPDLVTAGRPSVAVRSPAHPLMRRLLERCRLPLAAPSANPFGCVSPTTAEHVQQSLGDRIDHILDGGPCEIGVESTIVDLREESDPVILRQGGVSRENLEQILGRIIRVHRKSPEARHDSAGAELAPGMLDRHYSPVTPVVLRTEPFTPAELAKPTPRIARVCFNKPAPHFDSTNVSWLTENGDTDRAARRLFALMRELDSAGFEKIVFEPAPDSGLGPAINDRLIRASAGSSSG